jgi:hypothetical protein
MWVAASAKMAVGVTAVGVSILGTGIIVSYSANWLQNTVNTARSKRKAYLGAAKPPTTPVTSIYRKEPVPRDDEESDTKIRIFQGVGSRGNRILRTLPSGLGGEGRGEKT